VAVIVEIGAKYLRRHYPPPLCTTKLRHGVTKVDSERGGDRPSVVNLCKCCTFFNHPIGYLALSDVIGSDRGQADTRRARERL
jgi:hypothetical protein